MFIPLFFNQLHAVVGRTIKLDSSNELVHSNIRPKKMVVKQNIPVNALMDS